MKIRPVLFLAVFVSSVICTLAQQAPNATSIAMPSSQFAAVPPPLSGTGTTDHITKWLSSTSIGNSGIFENSSLNVGVGTVTPATKFDVNGTGDFRNTLTLFPNGTHPALSVAGSAFQISSAGKVTFVGGQTYPGAGTVTTVNSGTGLIGGPIHTTGTLSVNSSVVPLLAKANVFTANQTIKGSLFANDIFLHGASASLVGEGGNPTSGQPGNSLTVFGGSPSSPATDLAGGDLILAGGNGFGAGGGGAVRIRAAAAGPSGNAPDTLVDRQIFGPKSVPMGGQSGNATIFFLNPANGDGAGATLRFTIYANDGGSNFVSETGSCVITAVVSSDGSMESEGLTFGADMAQSGVVNASCDIVGGLTGNQVGISISDSLPFAPTTHNIYFEIDNVSGSPVVMNVPLPSSAGAVRLGQSVSPIHRRTEVHSRR